MIKRELSLLDVFVLSAIVLLCLFAAIEMRSSYILKSDVMLITDVVNTNAKSVNTELIEFKSSALILAEHYTLKPVGDGAFIFTYGDNTRLCVLLLADGGFYGRGFRLPTGKRDHQKIITHCESNKDVTLTSVMANIG